MIKGSQQRGGIPPKRGEWGKYGDNPLTHGPGFAACEISPTLRQGAGRTETGRADIVSGEPNVTTASRQKRGKNVRVEIDHGPRLVDRRDTEDRDKIGEAIAAHLALCRAYEN